MTTDAAQKWLSLLEEACTQAGTHHLDIVIDQSGYHTSLLPSVKSIDPPLSWYSLFTGLPEEGLLDIAPLLVRVDLRKPLQKFWLLGVVHELRDQSVLLALVSLWRFTDLGQHLSRCLEADHGGRSCMLRYFDPRVFAVLFSDVLLPDQQQRWLQPALLWSWLDLDGRPQRLAGTGTAFAEQEGIEPLVVDDDQADALGCVSDAVMAMSHVADAFNPEWTKEQCFRASYVVMREANSAGVCTLRERKTLLLEQLGCAS